MPDKRSVEEVKAEIEEEIRSYLENHVVGRMTNDLLVVECEAFVRSWVDDRLPYDFCCTLINPHIEGTAFVADGIEIKRRES